MVAAPFPLNPSRKSRANNCGNILSGLILNRNESRRAIDLVGLGAFRRINELQVLLDEVEIVDAKSGAQTRDRLEDQRQFDTSEVERTVTSPDSNRKIVEELKKHADEHERQCGRFPKTLIFAGNDLHHTSHADQLVEICREVFGRGDSFVRKITGRVDRPLQQIREFRNRALGAFAAYVRPEEEEE